MKKFSLQPLPKNQTCGTWKVPEQGALPCHREKLSSGKAAGHGAQLHCSPSLPCLTGSMSLLALLAPAARFDLCAHALTHNQSLVYLSQAVKDK